MSIQEQLSEIEKNVASVEDPEVLFAMNTRYRELQNEAKNDTV